MAIKEGNLSFKDLSKELYGTEVLTPGMNLNQMFKDAESPLFDPKHDIGKQGPGDALSEFQNYNAVVPSSWGCTDVFWSRESTVEQDFFSVSGFNIEVSLSTIIGCSLVSLALPVSAKVTIADQEFISSTLINDLNTDVITFIFDYNSNIPFGEYYTENQILVEVFDVNGNSKKAINLTKEYLTIYSIKSNLDYRWDWSQLQGAQFPVTGPEGVWLPIVPYTGNYVVQNGLTEGPKFSINTSTFNSFTEIYISGDLIKGEYKILDVIALSSDTSIIPPKIPTEVQYSDFIINLSKVKDFESMYTDIFYGEWTLVLNYIYGQNLSERKLIESAGDDKLVFENTLGPEDFFWGWSTEITVPTPSEIEYSISNRVYWEFNKSYDTSNGPWLDRVTFNLNGATDVEYGFMLERVDGAYKIGSIEDPIPVTVLYEEGEFHSVEDIKRSIAKVTGLDNADGDWKFIKITYTQNKRYVYETEIEGIFKIFGHEPTLNIFNWEWINYPINNVHNINTDWYPKAPSGDNTKVLFDRTNKYPNTTTIDRPYDTPVFNIDLFDLGTTPSYIDKEMAILLRKDGDIHHVFSPHDRDKFPIPWTYFIFQQIPSMRDAGFNLVGDYEFEIYFKYRGQNSEYNFIKLEPLQKYIFRTIDLYPVDSGDYRYIWEFITK